MSFSQLVPRKHESVGRVLLGHQLGKQSDVQQIMLPHKGSVIDYTPNLKYPLVIQLKEELCDRRYMIWTAISHGHIKYQITAVGSHGSM